MNPFIYTHTCDVCGGEGGATTATNNAAWHGAFISHRDPRVCAANLAQQKSIANKQEDK